MSPWLLIRRSWALVLAVLWHAAVHAHDSRPLFIQMEFHHDDSVLLAWKVPDTVAQSDAPFISLTQPCVAAHTEANNGSGPQSGSLQGLNWYQCPQESGPAEVRIEWPGAAPSLSTLVRLQHPTGSVRTVHASPGEVVIALPTTPSTGVVIQQYLVLGVEHILAGFDHLLFVGCLVLLAATFRRIAAAVTGFTIAHSVTLMGAALDVVRLPIPPVEAVIALSIVFLAAELARERRDTLTWRYPIVVAAAFGLLHGFGFAAVLGDIGLPDGEAFAALLSFNLGVEVGQLVFVGVLLGLGEVGRRLVPPTFASASFQRFAAYPIGVLATFWTLQRLSGFV